LTAGLRLDEAVRGFLTEQGSKRLAREELWRLIGGTLRLRLTAHAIAQMPRDCASVDATDRIALAQRAEDLGRWYGRLADHMAPARNHAPGALTAPPADDDRSADASRQSVWLREHLDHLSDHLPALVEPATHVSEIRRRPWWR
jgi:hypothetical protein